MSYEYYVRPGDMFRTPIGVGFITAIKNKQIEYDNVGHGDLSMNRPRVSKELFYSDLDSGNIELFPLQRKYRRKRTYSVCDSSIEAISESCKQDE